MLIARVPFHPHKIIHIVKKKKNPKLFQNCLFNVAKLKCCFDCLQTVSVSHYILKLQKSDVRMQVQLFALTLKFPSVWRSEPAVKLFSKGGHCKDVVFFPKGRLCSNSLEAFLMKHLSYWSVPLSRPPAFQNETRKDRSQVQVPGLLSGGPGQETEAVPERDCGPGLGQPASPCGAADLPAPVPSGPRQGLVRVPLLEWRLSHAGPVEEVRVRAQPAGDVLLALHSPWPHSADHQEARPAPAVCQLQGAVNSFSCCQPVVRLHYT